MAKRNGALNTMNKACCPNGQGSFLKGLLAYSLANERPCRTRISHDYICFVAPVVFAFITKNCSYSALKWDLESKCRVCCCFGSKVLWAQFLRGCLFLAASWLLFGQLTAGNRRAVLLQALGDVERHGVWVLFHVPCDKSCDAGRGRWIDTV